MHVSKSGVDTSLSSHGMRSGWEKLGDASGFEACFGQSKGSSESCTTGSHNNSVILVINDSIVSNE